VTEPLVFLTGQFLPASQAKLNIFDLGIILGATFTEMTRTFRHQPFRLPEHIERLYRSLKYGGITLPYTPEEMLQITLRVIEANCRLIPKESDLGIVHFVTPGENLVYAGSAGTTGPLNPTVCVHTFPLAFSIWRHLFTEGAHVVTPAIRHVPPQCVDPKTKNRSRLHWFLADNQSHLVDPKAITLLLDLDGNITECGGSNFVIVSGSQILSPTSRNILPGISLKMVRELAPGLGLKYLEKDLQVYDVVNADEAWLTTTPYCIAPCTKINRIPIGTGCPGPVFRRVLAAWSELVGMDIEDQILNSTI